MDARLPELMFPLILMEIEYRVIGINLAVTNASSASKASEQIKMPEEYLKKEFPKQYLQNSETNTALQCQTVLNIYGKFGWEHYQQGQLGKQVMLYFKRQKQDDKVEIIRLEPKEEAIIQKLDPQQRPY